MFREWDKIVTDSGKRVNVGVQLLSYLLLYYNNSFKSDKTSFLVTIDRNRFNAIGQEGYTAGKLLELMQMLSPVPLIGPLATVYPVPKYMGVWCTTEAVNGPFFMWVDEPIAPQKISGRIEDDIGIAKFEGNLSNGTITHFVKRYDKTPGDAITYRVIDQKEGVYSGTYRFGLENGSHDGCFVLEDYRPSDTLNAIVAKMCENNRRT